jgi:2-polyprenyl-6-methoxyphenol hydroxylase-like FAD-dependent oxidoreductase
MRHRTVLISGAGIAGPTLAYWLARHGFQPTVVERGAALRSSGSPVDVRGRAVDVATRMGVMPRLREAGTDVAGMSFVNPAGSRVGRVNMRALRLAAGSGEVELPSTSLQRRHRDHTFHPFTSPEGRAAAPLRAVRRTSAVRMTRRR